jgi:hypothetical protein
MDRRVTHRRAVRDGAIIAGLLFAAYLFIVVAPQQRTVGFDAFGYWSVDPAHPYVTAVGGLSAFNYSPPIARLFALFANVDWYTFLWMWLAVLVATVVWLGGRGPKVIWLLAFPPVALELYHGNVHLLIAAAIVLGFRYPWTWAFILLTKVTPGVGLVWFAVRREWRSLAIALGVTAAIAGVSVAVDGSLWADWFGFLGRTGAGTTVGQFEIPVPLWVRLPAALALVAWGGLTDRRWTVVLAATLGLPILWPSGFAVCAALASEPLQAEANRRMAWC